MTLVEPNSAYFWFPLSPLGMVSRSLYYYRYHTCFQAPHSPILLWPGFYIFPRFHPLSFSLVNHQTFTSIICQLFSFLLMIHDQTCPSCHNFMTGLDVEIPRYRVILIFSFTLSGVFLAFHCSDRYHTDVPARSQSTALATLSCLLLYFFGASLGPTLIRWLTYCRSNVYCVYYRR